MKLITTSLLAAGLACSAAASAQAPYGGADRGYYGNDYGNDGYRNSAVYDYARVVSVRPVMGGYGSQPTSAQRCYERRDGYAGDYRDDYYGRDGYDRDGYDHRDRYNQRDYGYGEARGTTAGRNVATIVGGIVGAAIGSQVGGGSARYATSAIGTMVGGMAGQSVYENSVRSRNARSGVVTVCDPVERGDYRASRGVDAYDVTYEYAGRQYTARTGYHPGDRIRVRVDVQPE